MLAVQTILHPTDFSDCSKYALRLACALARDHGAHLVLLHVAASPLIGYPEGVVPPDPETYRDGVRELLDRVDVPPDLPVERRLAEGDAVTEILRTAEEVGADLIAMGTHGRTGLGRLLMGSVAELVVRQASCPVLTVKTPFPERVREAKVAAETATV